jgi:hypothetical protein
MRLRYERNARVSQNSRWRVTALRFVTPWMATTCRKRMGLVEPLSSATWKTSACVATRERRCSDCETSFGGLP